MSTLRYFFFVYELTQFSIVLSSMLIVNLVALAVGPLTGLHIRAIFVIPVRQPHLHAAVRG
jgi:hypothetical protein